MATAAAREDDHLSSQWTAQSLTWRIPRILWVSDRINWKQLQIVERVFRIEAACLRQFQCVDFELNQREVYSKVVQNGGRLVNSSSVDF